MEIVKQILGNINWLAVFVAALVNFFIGALWYSKMLFAKPWAKEVYGVNDPSEIKAGGNMGYIMGTAFFMTFITAFALGVFMYMFGSEMPDEYRLKWGLGCAFLVALFTIANTFKHYLFEQKSVKLLLINGGHDLVCIFVMAFIMIYWK